MRGRAILWIGFLPLLSAGCLGRGDAEPDGSAGKAWEVEAAAGEEIARYLDATERDEATRFLPAERDPFAALRPAAVPVPAKVSVKAAEPAPSKPAPRLVGILHGGGGSSARIGGETYHVGDRVAGHRIVAIDEDHIILEREGTGFTVEVGRTLPDPGEGGIGS